MVKIPLLVRRSKVEMCLICVYRLQEMKFEQFLDEFSDFVSTIITTCNYFIIAGDFNIHLDVHDPHTSDFNNLLECYDLKQHINEPTHIHGHILDIILKPNYELDNISVNKLLLSDHFLIYCEMSNVRCATESSKTISYRKLNINNEAFTKDIIDNFEKQPNCPDFTSAINWYNITLSGIVENHAPLLTRTIKVKPHAPWFDTEYSMLRRQRRAAEKKFKKSQLAVHKEEFQRLRKVTTVLARTKKKSFISKKLSDNSAKTLYQITNQLMDAKEEKILPSASSDVELANTFMDFFSDKIEKLRKSVSSNNFIDDNLERTCSTGILNEFEPATVEEIRTIVKDYPLKCSQEDPVPVKLLLPNLDIFLPVWTSIVNLSLSLGCMDALKDAILTPIPKNIGIDPDILRNFRPISNLPLLSKIIERIVASRLNQHMMRNRLFMDEQYGYKKAHSTEYLLMKVLNDLLLACDKGTPSIVILLDLSAEFDTVDHIQLLNILKNEIGIHGTALKWFESFLVGRKAKVKISTSYSDLHDLLYGVPQGSVLGPILFSIYVRGLYGHIQSTRFCIEGFADDHQLSKQFLISMQAETHSEIVRCLKLTSEWMAQHFLCLNENKTKILVIAPPEVQLNIIVRGIFF